MATIIRLKRMGAKKRPFYRIIAIDSRKPASGPYLDNLGQYDPVVKPAKLMTHEDKIFKWLDDGAEMSQTIQALFKQIGLIQKYQAKKDGQDVSEMEDKTTMTERPKKLKKKKKAE